MLSRFLGTSRQGSAGRGEHKMIIRPIRNDEDHRAALATIDRLWGAKVGSPDGDALDVLATLVDAYENTRWPIEAVDPVDTIKAHMEATGRNQADLAEVIGSRSRASEIIARKRPLTINMVRNIASEWHLPAGVLIAPYELKTPSAKKGTRRATRPRSTKLRKLRRTG
jgi:HTH-type transcriptional regulator/antitoxin HigA